jgi:hypothetical protein
MILRMLACDRHQLLVLEAIVVEFMACSGKSARKKGKKKGKSSFN